MKPLKWTYLDLYSIRRTKEKVFLHYPLKLFFYFSGILSQVRTGLEINNEQAGLLQTAFVASFMVFAPLFGYLGDRCNRKWVMVVGITIWSVATLLGSFMEEFYRY